MPRVIVYLTEIELEALKHLSERENRDPRAQAALIIRRALQRARLLPKTSLPHRQPTPPSETSANPQEVIMTT